MSGATGDLTEIDDYVRERMAATRTPGLAFAVVGPDGAVHQRAWGRDGHGGPVTASTPFLWGSVSKPVTATAVMTLVEARQLDLDAPVRRYLPWFGLAGEDAADHVTVRHLLTHTSGIPGGTGVTDRFEQVDDPYRRGVTELAGVAPRAAPGQRHAYTSANYLVLGAVVEAVTGARFGEYLRGAVLKPCGMTGTITTPAQARATLPPGHRYVVGKPVAMPSPYDPTGPAYGYLGGTIDDLAAFAAAHLARGLGLVGRVLSDGSVAAMHIGTAQNTARTAYGLGWRDTYRDGVQMVWHGGGVAGYQAMLVLLPEHDRAMVMVQNAYGYFQDAALAAAGLGAARLIAGLRPDPVRRTFAYPLALGAVSAATALSLAALSVPAAVCATYRLLRPPRQPAGGRAAAAKWDPPLFGVRLRDVPLYAPDIGWPLAATAALAASLLPSRRR
jgi:CubicO group peptidase (beta-lactamase class C family)